MKLHDRIDIGLFGKPLGYTISLDPVTYTEGGGGFLDDLDVTFLALKFITSEGTPYDKGGAKIVPLLKVDMLPDGTEEVHTQYFSCGDLANWSPSTDGETLTDVKKSGGSISKSCNAAMFITSLVQAGIPGAKLATEKISDIAGVKAHVVRTKRPKDNIKRAEGAKEPDVLTVSRLISVPWQAAPTGVAGSPRALANAQSATAAAPSGNGHTVFGNAELAALAATVLLEKGGSLPKTQLMLETYKKAVAGAVAADAKDEAGKPARTTVAEKMNNDAFLGSFNFWRYDGATVTLV